MFPKRRPQLPSKNSLKSGYVRSYDQSSPVMIRLPAHLESFVPPPREQVPQSLPWRGSIILSAPSAPSTVQTLDIRVTAAEIEGDNRQETWPQQFQVRLIRRNGVLREVQNWILQSQQSGVFFDRCMLMPDRLPERAASQENQATFERFSQQLRTEEIVAIAPWSSHPGAPGGLLLYPTTTSRALLVGVIFLDTNFPEFLFRNTASPGGGAGPSRSTTMYNPHIGSFQPSGTFGLAP